MKAIILINNNKNLKENVQHSVYEIEKIKEIDKVYFLCNDSTFNIATILSQDIKSINSIIVSKLTIYFNMAQDFTITRDSDRTEIKGNVSGETITIDSANKIITSDRTVSRFFGDNFNWVWPKLTYGDNKFSVSPIPTPNSSNAPLVTFKYRYPIKCGQF